MSEVPKTAKYGSEMSEPRDYRRLEWPKATNFRNAAVLDTSFAEGEAVLALADLRDSKVVTASGETVPMNQFGYADALLRRLTAGAPPPDFIHQILDGQYKASAVTSNSQAPTLPKHIGVV